MESSLSFVTTGSSLDSGRWTVDGGLSSVVRWIGNPSPNSHLHYTPSTHSRQALLCANPHQLLTSGYRPLLFSVRRDLMHLTSEECPLPTFRIWHTTPLTTPSQRLLHTNPRFAACAISTAQDYPNVWTNSSSGIGPASTPALCNNRSCPASGAARLLPNLHLQRR